MILDLDGDVVNCQWWIRMADDVAAQPGEDTTKGTKDTKK